MESFAANHVTTLGSDSIATTERDVTTNDATIQRTRLLQEARTTTITYYVTYTETVLSTTNSQNITKLKRNYIFEEMFKYIKTHNKQ